MLLHPDAEEALILHPAQAEMNSNDAMAIRDALPKVVLQRLFKLLKKNRAVKLGTIRGWLTDTAEFDCAIGEIGAKMKKKDKDPLDKELKANYPSGRAPYARDVMRKVTAEVMAGQDPRSEGGTLYALHAEKKSLPESEIDQKTNNHLVRHRLRIMRRLIDEIVREYAKGDKARIDQVTIEVNRDVKELSGKTAKLIAQDMTTRLRSHKEAVEYASAQLEVPSHRLGGSFIRKVRIAMDTGWTCPYTGQEYDIHALRSRSVDLDHIIPRSKRTSDSLDSLVITFKAINAWKSNTTALEFVETQGGKAVPGMPNLSILSTQHYRELVETLGKKRVSHADDKHRRDNRCKRLLTRRADDKDVAGFTPRDLTVSSHLVKLALAVAADVFREEESPPDIRTIPGRITKEVRCSWNLLGHLATVNPQVISAEGELKTKTEIREVTHLHHAVDAMTIALARTLIPANGTIWELMIKRNLRPHEREQLEKTGAFVFDSDGRAHLRDLHEETLASLQSALAECRVATHIPAGKRGATLEKNAWGIIQRTKDMVEIRQQSRDEKTDVIIRKTDRVHVNKLLGITPRGTSKLQSLKGVIVISDNYGVALDPAPEVIPYHQVWRRLGVLKKKNGGVMPRILRKGMLIGVAKGRYAGLWKVCSIKNKQRDGILLEVSTPDGVASATEPRLLSLIRDGLEIHPVLYTGIPRCVTPCD
jgi:CRISPR-associated endonuclease Csn1